MLAPLGFYGDTNIVSLEGGNIRNVATAGTAVQLSTTTVPVSAVIIQAYETNTGNICVGGSDVDETIGSRKGIVLVASQSLTLAVSDLTTVYLDSAVNGEGVSYLPLKG